MLGHVLRHEWRLLTRDGSLWLVAGVFALALAYGAFNGARWVRFQTHTLAEAAQEEQTRFAAQEAAIARLNAGTLELSPFADPRNPQVAASRLAARFAVMPPAPLAALSIGQSDLLPSYLKVTSDAKQDVVAGAELENPHRLLTGRFDVAFVLIYFYPLLILAFTFNLLAVEREQGTLSLALSQPVSLATLALGKLAVRFGLFLVTIAALAAVALVVAGLPAAGSRVLVLLPLWFAAVVVYGLVWFALAVLVASFGRPSSTNAMLLAGLWLVLVILVPSLLDMGATALYPVPSRVTMIQTMREASDEANEKGASLLSRYYQDHPELAVGDAGQAMNDFNVVRLAVDAEVQGRVQPVLDRYERQLAAQRRLIAGLRILSPAILMQEALNDLSGTGTARHRYFLDQVSAFHDRWRAYFTPLIVGKRQVERYASLPAFVFEDERAGAAAGRVAASLALMALPAIVLGAIGLRRLRRFPVV